jgi:hypothetical protein
MTSDDLIAINCHQRRFGGVFLNCSASPARKSDIFDTNCASKLALGFISTADNAQQLWHQPIATRILNALPSIL